MDEPNDRSEQNIVVDQLDDGRWVASVRGGAEEPGSLEFVGAFVTEEEAVTAATRHREWQRERLALSACTRVRRLLALQPARVWTLDELAGEGDLSLTEAKIAVELLVPRGELVRRGAELYRRPIEGEVKQIVDRSACREQTCTCHDESAWVPQAYPNGCAECGCRWKVE